MGKKKYIELSEDELRTKMKNGSIPKGRIVKDEDIDFSDMPAMTDEQLKKFRRVGRPLKGDSPRVPVHFRLESDVLKKIKKEAKARGVPYQSLLNEILKKAV